MAVIGYARVSTQEQKLDLQRRALAEFGCDPIFEDDGVSATAAHRPGFEKALRALKSGDTFVVWKMDRAFRSLKGALDVLEQFEARNIRFRCLTEPVDTDTSLGRCMYQVRHVFAELERNLIRERTVAGMEAARRRGVRIGRPPKLTRQQVLTSQQRLSQEPGLTARAVAQQLGVSRRTLDRAMRRHADD